MLLKPKRFLLLMLCQPVLGMSQWVKIDETPGMTTFADISTMLASDDNRVARVLMDFKGPIDDDLASTITEEKFDCAMRLRQTLKGEHFSENMGQGKPNYSYAEPLRWKKVVKGDGWEPVFKLVCGYSVPSE